MVIYFLLNINQQKVGAPTICTKSHMQFPHFDDPLPWRSGTRLSTTHRWQRPSPLATKTMGNKYSNPGVKHGKTWQNMVKHGS